MQEWKQDRSLDGYRPPISFPGHLYLEMDGKHVNAKSIMGMMSLVLTNGVVVTIDAEGTDEVEAVEALERLLTGK